MRILMVCLGNICRSPLAEGIMKHKAKLAGLDWHIDSAGTGSWHSGQLPDQRSVQVAKKYGIDITDQRARQFERDDFERFDRIFVMDTRNHQDVLRLANNSEDPAKVELILNLCHPGENRSVPDPYLDDDGFEAVFQMLENACGTFVGRHRV